MEAKFKRNVILVGHAHAGKTSLVESLLFTSGATSRKGDVMKGNSVGDYNEDEIERRISINAHFLKAVFQEHQIQFIDTPGYADFIGETIAALRATDSAIVVIDAVHGVEVGTEDIWERLETFQIPRIIFINKCDKPEANCDAAMSAIKEQLSKNIAILDLDSAELIEAVAETDDKLLEKYLNTGNLSSEEIKGALRKAILQAKIFPVLQGSTVTDAGVKDLLEAIVAYFPSPVEHPAFQVKDLATQEIRALIPQEDGPFAGLVFKSIFDPHIGQLSLIRILRGKLTSNSDFFNVNTESREHISTLTTLNGKDQISINQASCGDIIALPKLKNTHVSDSLTDEKEKLLLEPIIFPQPSISASIKPKTRDDEEKISLTLNRLCEEDHTFQVNRDNETKELIISGIGDLHLKVLLERMKRRYHVDVNFGAPKVAYRETIIKKVRARHKYKKQSGGRGQYGDVELEVTPLPRDGSPFEFASKIFGGAIPRNYIPSIEKGVRQAVGEGVLAGYPLINIQVTVVDGSYHEVDSSDMAFQIAALMAFKEAIKLAGLVLLEPIAEVNIIVPDEFIGNISGDINARRGRILGAEAKGKNEVIKAHIPVSEIITYATDLRSMTAGRGSYTMKFSHYEQAPAKVTSQVIASKQEKETAAHN